MNDSIGRGRGGKERDQVDRQSGRDRDGESRRKGNRVSMFGIM